MDQYLRAEKIRASPLLSLKHSSQDVGQFSKYEVTLRSSRTVLAYPFSEYMGEVVSQMLFRSGHRLTHALERCQHQCFESWETFSYELGKEWIQSCTKHSFCRKAQPPIDQMFPPTCLIEVTSPTGARLVGTSMEEKSAYLMLSHCWGKLDPNTRFVTLDSREKINVWTKSIPVEELAKNF
jgi:hypothetical protein